MKVITIASQKGGVGKTAITALLLRALAGMGKRVLGLDLDHNNNLTDAILREVPVEKIESSNAYHVFAGERSAQDCIHDSNGIPVLPCTPYLSRIGRLLVEQPARMVQFGQALRLLPFDMVLIDTHNGETRERAAALLATDIVICPAGWDRWVLQGYEVLRDEVLALRPDPPPIWVVPSAVTRRDNDILRTQSDLKISRSTIFRAAAIKRALNSGRPLSPSSASFSEFESLAREVLKWR